MAQAKGSALIATIDFIRAEKGEDVLASVLDRIPAGDRPRITSCKATDEVPLDLALVLWRAADEELRDAAPESARLSTAEERVGLIESHQPENRVLFLFLHNLHVAGMIVEPEQ